MKAQLLNRLAVIFSFAGIFVAGVLSLGHALGVAVPCGAASHGCDIVATDSSSFIGGRGGTPVAYVGLVGYILIAALAVYRALRGGPLAAKLVMPGYLMAAVGTVVSLYLQYISLTKIHALCIWCLSSAIVMSSLLVIHALLAQADEDPSPSNNKDFMTVVGMSLFVLVGLGGTVVSLRNARHLAIPGTEKIKTASAELIIPADAHFAGPADAPVTVVEFADLMCPVCRSSFSEIGKVLEKHKNVRWVYRHFPLYHMTEHRLALPAAAIAEYAAEKGKFWQYIGAVFAAEETDLRSADSFLQIAASLGLDVEDCKKRISDENDPVFKRTLRDIDDGDKMGISETPTMILVSPGHQNLALRPGDLDRVLSSPPYSDILKGQ